MFSHRFVFRRVMADLVDFFFFFLRYRKAYGKVPGIGGRDDGVRAKDGLAAPTPRRRPKHRHGHQ